MRFSEWILCILRELQPLRYIDLVDMCAFFNANSLQIHSATVSVCNTIGFGLRSFLQKDERLFVLG